MRTLLTAFASVLLLLAGSCTSPLASLKGGVSPLPAVGANETRLVLNFTPPGRLVDYNYDTSHIKYVVVQLNNKLQQRSRFATGAVTAGTTSIVFTGLVAGPWEVMAACYDWDGNPANLTQSPQSPDTSQPYLLYSGSTQIDLTPGTSIPVKLLLYQPGDISAITVVAAKLATTVTLLGQQSSVLAGSPRFQVSAVAKAADMSSIDTDQRFEWSSDNPNVAFVDGTGGVTPKNTGKARVTAKTLIGGVAAFFDLTVETPLVGYWKQTNANSYLRIFRHADQSLRWEALNSVGNSNLYSMPTTPLTSTKVRGGVALAGPSTGTLEAREIIDYTFTAGVPAPTFNQWIPATVMSQQVLLDAGDKLVWGTGTTPPTYERLSSYVPVTALWVDSAAVLTTGSSTLLARITTPTAATPTVPSVYWMSSSSSVVGLNFAYSSNIFGAYAGLPGYPLASIVQPVSFSPGSATLTLLAIDFDPVYRTTNTVAGAGDAVVFTQAVSVAAGSSNPTALTIVSSANTLRTGETMQIRAVPTPFWAAIPQPTWASSNPSALTITPGPIVSPSISWVATGASDLQATITGGFAGSPMSSNPLTITTQ